MRFQHGCESVQLRIASPSHLPQERRAHLLESILVFRMDSVDPAIKMPEISKSVVHDEGVALVRDWIAGLPGACDPRP